MSRIIAPPPRRRSRPEPDRGADRLALLSQRRGTIPLLAELHRGRGAKFITLVNRLGLSRPTVRHTVDEAIEAGWVMRNPGYGHPLRPEYILTEAARSLGTACDRLHAKLEHAGIFDIALRKWSLPLLYALRSGPCRFGDLRAALPAVTDRALTMAVKDLIEAGLIAREVGDDYPPAPVYRCRPAARAVIRELRSLVRTLSD